MALYSGQLEVLKLALRLLNGVLMILTEEQSN